MRWTEIDGSRQENAFVGFLDTVSRVEQIKEYKSRSYNCLNLRRGKSVLDVGCGTGEDICALAEIVGNEGEAVGVDVSAQMLREAKLRSQSRLVCPQFIQASAYELPFEDNKFDASRIDRVLQHLDEPGRAIAELVRVTKYGGILFASEPDWETMEIRSRYQQVARMVRLAVVEGITNRTIGKQLRNRFVAIGLEYVEEEQKTVEFKSMVDAEIVLCLTKILTSLIEAKKISRTDAALFLEEQWRLDEEKKFLLKISGYGVVGRKGFKPVVNDRHSQLNSTQVNRVIVLSGVSDIQNALWQARSSKNSLCVAGGCHAMGAQQFLGNGILVDTGSLNAVLDFDSSLGLVKAQAGILWPELINWLQKKQEKSDKQWTIVQKQTGCDQLSLGGAVSANIHGRGLKMRPIIDDIQSIELIAPKLNSEGPITCNRKVNAELFRLVVGGYGLFGVIYSVTLKLTPRKVLRRDVSLCTSDEVISALNERIKQGAEYGDFQFAIDDLSEDFLYQGILSTYTPIESDECELPNQKILSEKDWIELLYLAHTDKAKAFDKYSQHYLATDGQLYLSDTAQLSPYINGYHHEVEACANLPKSSEIITELYVPRGFLAAFLHDAREYFRQRKANIIYGTVRLIEQDNESFLPWAKLPYACVVFNLHVEHEAEALTQSQDTLVGLIDLALAYGGSYYLTYHKFARKDQLERCYPQFQEFLCMKIRYDPLELLQSNWYRHCKQIIGRC